MTEIVDGEVAYNIYRRAHAEQNCGTDPWEALDESEQAAWNAVAAQLWGSAE